MYSPKGFIVVGDAGGVGNDGAKLFEDADAGSVGLRYASERPVDDAFNMFNAVSIERLTWMRLRVDEPEPEASGSVPKEP